MARALVFLPACLAGFGQWQGPYLFFAQLLALLPGAPGSYLRVAYYSFTLDRVGPDCEIALGSYFAHPAASLGRRVGVGSYCVLGSVDIGDGSLLGSRVQVLSGTRQHTRDGSGFLTDEGRIFQRISIGAHCWVGAGAIVSADVGEKTTIAPGSVVGAPVPQGSTVSGNPARNFSQLMRTA
jgi:acetyltransferase-like isoleucine patch superfamily enzyme